MAHAKKKRKAAILGVGLDSDGNKRITTWPNFAPVVGTLLFNNNFCRIHPVP